MHRVADAFSEHAEELATIDALDGGKAIAASRNEAGAAASFWHFAAGHAEGLTGETHNAFGADSLGLMLREPIGVVGVITPWNYPMVIASERVPWASRGRVHRGPQAVGVYLRVHPSVWQNWRVMRACRTACSTWSRAWATPSDRPWPNTLPQTFSASPVRAESVGRRWAGRRPDQEGRPGAGGKGPVIVFADSDLDAAADSIACSVFHNSGQTCVAGSRLIVEEGAAQPLLDRLVSLAKRVPIGDPLDERVKVGAMIHRPHREKVERYVASGVADGAEIIVGGTRLGETGNYFAPTIFTNVKPGSVIAREEIFGPVLTTFEWTDPADAIRLANDTEYGLSAHIWSSNLESAIQTVRRVRAGRTWINGQSGGGPEMGVGAFKGSGIGRELGRYGFDEYSEPKNVHVTLHPKVEWLP